jgi:glycosyltransferase involved in cell wall biosynthesis
VRLGFYSSSLHICGGGEKYFLTVVEEAVKRPHDEVILMSPTQPRPRDWERLGVFLSPESFTWRKTSDRALIGGTAGLDVFVCVRGSPPLSHARRSIAIVQFPSRDLFAKQRMSGPRSGARTLRNAFERFVVSRYDLVVCYSEFARRYTATYLGRPDAVVIYPPVDPPVASSPKEPIILGVARFFEMKRHDALIEAFRRLRLSLPTDSPWELHLAGGLGADTASNAYVAHLRELARGLPVVFHPNAPLTTLQGLYQRALIFWHAAGLDSDHIPVRQEHFGITTVEAMNHACVPVVIARGGQPEIVSDGINGLLWQDLDEVVTRTLELISQPDRLAALGRAAAGNRRFTTSQFRQDVRDVILPSTTTSLYR